jgi:hypothetical protein
LIITGQVYRFVRDSENNVASKVTFDGISLLFPSNESYVAKSESTLLCFTKPELNLSAKGSEPIARAEKSTLNS